MHSLIFLARKRRDGGETFRLWYVADHMNIAIPGVFIQNALA